MKNRQPTFMFSPCGTSLLTNLADNGERALIKRYANATESDIDKQDLSQLQGIIDKARTLITDANFQQVCDHSAELNAISRYYRMGQAIDERDIHLLLSSDTWLGSQTSFLVKAWLSQHVSNVQIRTQKDLATDNMMQFQSALSELVKFTEEHIEPYRESNYHIVFNLTGGFKSVQGFLQTLAMFYADAAVYVFQSQEELLFLPRLPVKMDAEQQVKKHLANIRKLSRNLSIPESELNDLSELFYIRIGEEIALSAWGELIWNRHKKDIYRESVKDPDHKKIILTDTFKKSVRELPSDRNYNLNERLDDLMVFVETGKNVKRLDFKALSGEPVPGSTHELDAFADRDAKRIFCHYEGEVLVLDKLDKALH